MARKFAAVVFSLGCFQASPLMALGLGEMTLNSYLNEPLRAQVDLLNTGGLHEDQIRIRLATADDFERMGVDRAYFLTSISFDVQTDDKGQPRIVITSEDPVLEPYLDFIVEARWPSGRLLREYTVLVDPPVFDNTTPVISAREQLSEMDGESAAAKKKTVSSSGSGTRVDIRNSDLAPGEMPRRAFNATTAGTPQPGARYMISRDDTLWEIASSAKPAGVSVQQTMLEIQRLNPDAFIGGNINRIKAGYIIYLPTEGEISAVNLAAAKQEVREQNNAWRAYKATEPDYTSGPSLRISADPVDAETSSGVAAGSEASGAAGALGTASLEDLEKSELERAELESRLAAMESQVETLQRIVSLKDDQISALQGVLAGEQAEGDIAALTAEEALIEQVLEETALRDDEEAAAAAEGMDAELVGDEPAAETQVDVVEVDVAETVETPEPVEVVTEPEVAEPVAAAPPPPAESGGFLSNIWYILAAVVAAVLAFVFIRRRKDADLEDEEAGQIVTPARSDSFADVELSEQPLEVEEPEEPPLPLEDELEEPASTVSGRGYGERKHDEYASDVEASDALAEADIYIAYGRYPQAFELLKNALANDPDNAEYRLKLVQMYAETGDRGAAEEQFGQLETLGDEASLAVARQALDSMDESPARRAASPDFDEAAGEDLMAEIDDSLEADFSGLEIEEPGDDELEDELDLSADFDDAELAPERLEEDLVVAADSNGMSTKLDLARAYMDMGDDDGARQILEEVAAEGSEELKAEARELLERIG